MSVFVSVLASMVEPDEIDAAHSPRSAVISAAAEV
jgi:hypothetical protein